MGRVIVSAKMNSSVPVSAVSVANSSPTGSAATTTRSPEEENFYRMVKSFSKHDTMQLTSTNFVQWQY